MHELFREYLEAEQEYLDLKINDLSLGLEEAKVLDDSYRQRVADYRQAIAETTDDDVTAVAFRSEAKHRIDLYKSQIASIGAKMTDLRLALEEYQKKLAAINKRLNTTITKSSDEDVREED